MIEPIAAKLAEVQNLDPEWTQIHVFGPKPEGLIDAAESLLGLKFPSDYRAFLRDFGGIFGIANGVLDPPNLHNSGCVVHETQIVRARYSKCDSKSFVLYYDPEDCICAIAKHCKVFVYNLSKEQVSLGSTEVSFNSCGEYILSVLSELVEDME